MDAVTRNKTTWGSHIPIHLALINTFDIQGSIEYGSGVHSTQMFFKNVPNIISIETDKKWVEYVKENVKGQDSTHKIKHLDLSSFFPKNRMVRSIRCREMGVDFFDSARTKITELGEYETMKPTYEHMFVDSISSLRYHILNTFYSMHSVITFHDYNKSGRLNHYRGGVKPPDGYQMFVDYTYPQHTGIWLREDLTDRINEVKDRLEKEISEYTGDHYKMNFVSESEYGNM